MRTKSITIRKPSGFQYSLTVSIVDTPRGAVRTIELKDHEVMMADQEPTDTWIMTFNENSLDTNTEQLKEFCEFILDEINQVKPKKYQKEYEAYMKIVTDAFVDMQSDKINGTIGHDRDRVFYEVLWDGGLDYKFDLNCSKYIKGVTLEEMKEHNAGVAKRYLFENTLSYDEWVEKYASDF